jgi:hypothetical protein
MVALLTLGFVNAPSYGKPGVFQGEEQGSVWRFKLREEYKVIVPASVNGLKPESFILDTGTRTSIVDERICRELDLQTIARMPLTTFTGTTLVTISRLESLSMGSASAKGLEVICADLRKVYSVDSEIYGILGQNFLVRFNYLLDYRERKIVLEENGNLRKDLRGAELPIEIKEYRDYVLFDSGSTAQQPVRFMLDSGAPLPVIFEDPQLILALRIERADQAVHSTGRGVDAGRIRTFQIGSEIISNLSVRLTRARDNERRWENGLLPTALFRGVYFNHENGYVILNPRVSFRSSESRLKSVRSGD